jgi:hypothetical protein
VVFELIEPVVGLPRCALTATGHLEEVLDERNSVLRVL